MKPLNRFYYAGRDEEATARLLRTLELESHLWIAHLTLGKVHLRQTKYADAVADFKKARQFSGDNSETISMVGSALAQKRGHAGAREVLDELKASSTRKYVPPHNIAMVYHGLGETDEAIEWLERLTKTATFALVF